MDLVKREKRYEGERDMVEWSVREFVRCEPLDEMDGGDGENLRELEDGNLR